MTQYNTSSVKLCISQLNKLKSGIKNGSEITLNLSSNLIGNSIDETNFPHKISLADTQVSKIRRAFAKGYSANINFSKTHLSKMQSGVRFLPEIKTEISGKESFDNFPFKMANSYIEHLKNANTKTVNENNEKNLLIGAGLNMICKKIKKLVQE